jgi:tRNA(adenine34) deaminase
MEFMEKAVEVAKKSGADIPVGAVIVKDGIILSHAHNEKETLNDATAHAEILAIRKASELLGNWRLDECTMYVTLEPCPMCAWAIMQARISSLYFGAYDNVHGGFGSVLHLKELANSQINIKGGILEEECTGLLKDYFAGLR